MRQVNAYGAVQYSASLLATELDAFLMEETDLILAFTFIKGEDVTPFVYLYFIVLRK